MNYYLASGLLFLNGYLHASFIEQTLGAAVVRDATAVYFNPGALTTISKPQLILLGTLARSQFEFTGSVQQIPLGLSESGSVMTQSKFALPSMYVSFPINSRFTGGFAVVANDFNRELDEHSVLRYVQPRNQTNALDLVPALGFKINEVISLGGNLNITYAKLEQEPVSGGPRFNIPDSQSYNNSKAYSWGGDLGVLVQLAKTTTLGLNYRSAVTYPFRGTSTRYNPQFISADNFNFKFWTPARTVISLSHFFNEHLGFIGTAQYLQWDIFKEAYIYNFVTQLGRNSFIVPQAQVNYYFHNSWLLTLGTIYNASPQWKVRVAGTYNQSPANGRYQIGTGDSLTVGCSMGYQMWDNMTVDFSYGHAFYQKELINISGAQNIIEGSNNGSHDAVSLKLTITA
ncbi:OmpP1/FadL family transporter [Legionella worsleiensis]|uniref:Long-chain fatty acid transporter n=1 Tax=Legionella worsleiensis TaxID=45076 RepID=A0A0W1AF49_9GAMM|nr:outer membrane protein transport protein [Legionella worsleiensis]KTD79964.1 long-chain fatty acid transporter [Legionella worsleiensis]STY32435.1 long-chain fatty acid transporter [Legionella worsleiensis]